MENMFKMKLEAVIDHRFKQLRDQLMVELERVELRIAEIVEYLRPRCQEAFLAMGKEYLDVTGVVTFPRFNQKLLEKFLREQPRLCPIDPLLAETEDYAEMRVGELLGCPTWLNRHTTDWRTILCKDARVRDSMEKSMVAAVDARRYPSTH